MAGIAPDRLPRLGMGTWRMGERAGERRAEVRALQLGIDLGMTLIDTAEMYGEGGAEEVVGEAIRGRRGAVRIVTKFYPHHASRRELAAACDRSLARLAVEAIDLYLLHWRGSVPLAETVEALERLVEAGKVMRWGVSNFDTADVEELAGIAGGERAAADQVLYNLAERGIESDLLGECERRGMDAMAYSPLDEGRLVSHPAVRAVAARLRSSPGQVALAWVLRDPRVIAIPKASTPEHVRANAACPSLALDEKALAALERAFPAPRRKRKLRMI